MSTLAFNPHRSLMLLTSAGRGRGARLCPGLSAGGAAEYPCQPRRAAVARCLLLVDRPPADDLAARRRSQRGVHRLSTFVGFTTSVFSASYIGHELETGRLTPGYLRFYHAMFQLMMFGMNLALMANNIGLMWVAIELATLTTIMMVGIYRTHEALEAAWKYFILGSVGIALALFGTILVYLAARAGDRRGHGRDGVDRPAAHTPPRSTLRC